MYIDEIIKNSTYQSVKLVLIQSTPMLSVTLDSDGIRGKIIIRGLRFPSIFVQNNQKMDKSYIPFRKPLIKLFMAVKQGWHYKMQKRPQFSHVILDRCSSQKQTITTIKTEQSLPPYTVRSNIQIVTNENRSLTN